MKQSAAEACLFTWATILNMCIAVCKGIVGSVCECSRAERCQQVHLSIGEFQLCIFITYNHCLRNLDNCESHLKYSFTDFFPIILCSISFINTDFLLFKDQDPHYLKPVMAVLG